MKKIFSISLLLCLSFSIFAQEKINIVFSEKHHNFGTVREEEGKVVTVFTFINTSQMPITIKAVKASCGCTTPTYSREPVLPNEAGKITVAYGAQGRPGAFNKTVTVQIGTDADTRTETLTISGTVLPRGKSIEEGFPYKIGDLLFREKNMNFGSIIKGDISEKTFEVFNNSESEQILSFANIPAYISISVDNAGKIAPKQKALIKISLYSEKTKNWGDISEKIQIKINGKNAGEYALNAVVAEDFGKITKEDFQQAPAAVLSTKNLNLTTV